MNSIFISRKFWAVVLPLLLLAISHFFPTFHMDAGAATGLVIIVAGYVLSVAADPGSNAGSWLGVLASRKFWASFIGLVVMFLDGFGIKWPLPISPENLIELALLLAAYNGGVAIEGLRQPPIDLQFKSSVSMETGNQSGRVLSQEQLNQISNMPLMPEEKSIPDHIALAGNGERKP